MFESFIIMLREGIEAALVVAITLVVVERANRKDLRQAVFYGLWLAVLASIAVAVILHTFLMTNDAYEGILYWVASIFVISMMVWMHRKANTLKAAIEQRVAQAAAAESEHSRRKEVAGLGAFTFFMVFREGVEAVLFLSAVNLTTTALLSFTGSLLGLAAATVFAALFVRGSLRVSLRRFFAITEWVLGIFVIQLLINGYHELAESGLMPATRQTMAWMGPVVKNNDLFLMAILGIPLFIWLTRAEATEPGAETVSPAQRRLVLAKARQDRIYRTTAAVCTLSIVGLVGFAYAQSIRPKTVPLPDPVIRRGNVVLIPVSGLADGKLHHFSYPMGGRDVVFLAMKTPSGSIKTALNACRICGPVGYIQDGPNLQCLNCEAEIEPPTLGMPGGCNPIPLPSRVAGATVEIPAADLAASAPVFNRQEGPVTMDPVCGMRLLPGQVGFTVTYKGKTYHFCKMPSCRALFLQDPEKYVGRGVD